MSLDPVTDAEWLQRYGPWGLLVLALSAIIFLYRANAGERDAHKLEMTALMNRLIDTTTAQVKEYSTLSNSVVATHNNVVASLAGVASTLEGLSRRIDDKGRRP